MSVKTIEYYNGQKEWQSSIIIPIEQARDEKFLNHVKDQLKERCVKEYIENIDDSFKYSIDTNRASREAVVRITMEDLFSLKRQNKKLHKEISELVDKYRALINEIKIP